MSLYKSNDWFNNVLKGKLNNKAKSTCGGEMQVLQPKLYYGRPSETNIGDHMASQSGQKGGGKMVEKPKA